jgi:hypothetical protein
MPDTLRLRFRCLGMFKRMRVCHVVWDIKKYTAQHPSPYFSLQTGIPVDAEDGLINFATDPFWGIYLINQHGITHYDVKPANIVFIDGRYMLIDYESAIYNQTTQVSDSATDAFSNKN